MRTLNTLIFTTFIALSGLIAVPVGAQEAEGYSQAELDQMLAPIALYPDTVLSHVLIAATYPLEVVQAARWARNNPGYSGQEAVAMVENQDWDPSVKALVAFPELLDRMDQDIGWTQGLGDAFLVQEGEVTDTIQYLRNQAYNNGQLQSNAQVNVVRETRYIYIEPAQPQVVYVPYYDPRFVYGSWRYAAYPPVYWHHPPGFSVSLGFYWGIGFHVQSNFFFSSFFWPSRHVVVVDHYYHDRYRNYGHGKGHHGYRPGYNMAHYDGARRWQHSSQHRRGVSYRGDIDQDRFSERGGSKRDRHGSRDQSAPVRTAQAKGKQRDWADQQRTRFADNAGNKADRPLRGDRSRDQSGADRARTSTRSSSREPNRNRSVANGEPRSDSRANTLADNTTRNGRQRTSNSDSGRRAAPLDSARDSGRARQELNARRTGEGVRNDLANAGASRRSNPQAVAPRSNKQEKSNRSVLPTPAGQPVVERRGQSTNPVRGSRAVTETRDRRVSSPARDANPKREAHYAAAAPQRSQKPATVSREAKPQRQAAPSREAAPVRQAKAERAPKQERAAQSQGSETRQASGKSERSNQSRGSRARERNSRD